MATARKPYSNATVIQQSTESGDAFDGGYPANGAGILDSTDTGRGMYVYPDATEHAGLFYWDTSEPVIVNQFLVNLNGSGSIDLYLVSLDNAGAVIAGSAIPLRKLTSVNFMALDETVFKVVLLPRQALQLITSVVGGQKQVAQAVAAIERTFMR